MRILESHSEGGKVIRREGELKRVDEGGSSRVTILFYNEACDTFELVDTHAL